MIYLIDEKLKDKVADFELITVTDFQTKEWWGSFEDVKEYASFWLREGKNHKLQGTILSREVSTAIPASDIDDLGALIESLDFDVSIVKTVLTYRGKKLNMLIDANDYQERY